MKSRQNGGNRFPNGGHPYNNTHPSQSLLLSALHYFTFMSPYKGNRYASKARSCRS